MYPIDLFFKWLVLLSLWTAHRGVHDDFLRLLVFFFTSHFSFRPSSLPVPRQNYVIFFAHLFPRLSLENYRTERRFSPLLSFYSAVFHDRPCHSQSNGSIVNCFDLSRKDLYYSERLPPAASSLCHHTHGEFFQTIILKPRQEFPPCLSPPQTCFPSKGPRRSVLTSPGYFWALFLPSLHVLVQLPPLPPP